MSHQTGCSSTAFSRPENAKTAERWFLGKVLEARPGVTVGLDSCLQMLISLSILPFPSIPTPTQLISTQNLNANLFCAVFLESHFLRVCVCSVGLVTLYHIQGIICSKFCKDGSMENLPGQG